MKKPFVVSVACVIAALTFAACGNNNSKPGVRAQSGGRGSPLQQRSQLPNQNQNQSTSNQQYQQRLEQKIDVSVTQKAVKDVVVPEEVVIDAKLEHQLRAVNLVQEEATIIAKLEGNIVVSSINPKVSLRLETGSRHTVISPDLGKCKLSPMNIGNIQKDLTGFLFLGKDEKSNPDAKCIDHLNAMGTNGFTIKLHDVHMDFLGHVVKTVILRVSLP